MTLRELTLEELSALHDTELREAFPPEELKPFAAAEELLMHDTRWGKIYDARRLAANETPLQAAVYADDMYVPFDLSRATLEHIGASHAWVTNEFEHDGVHGSQVFRHLYNEAMDRGDLAGI